jgi:hypothetical protein
MTDFNYKQRQTTQIYRNEHDRIFSQKVDDCQESVDKQISGFRKAMDSQSEGGYLLPETITSRKPGIMAYLRRIINLKSGWKEYNPKEEIVRMMGTK